MVAQKKMLGWLDFNKTCTKWVNEVFFKLGFTPSKAEQPLRGMELQEKEAQKRLEHIGNQFRKNLQLKDVC